MLWTSRAFSKFAKVLLVLQTLVAKSLLFESLSKRPTTRKREGKALRDLEDIICLFKETDPEEFPIFVARKLEKLPPVSFDHIDVTALLKRIVLLEKNIQDFHQHYATKTDISEQINEYFNDSRNINIQRGGRVNLFDSGPMALPTLCAIHSPVVEREVATKSPSLSPTQRPPPMSSPVAIRDVNMSASRTTNICVDQQSGRRAKQSPERITDITTRCVPLFLLLCKEKANGKNRRKLTRNGRWYRIRGIEIDLLVEKVARWLTKKVYSSKRPTPKCHFLYRMYIKRFPSRILWITCTKKQVSELHLLKLK